MVKPIPYQYIPIEVTPSLFLRSLGFNGCFDNLLIRLLNTKEKTPQAKNATPIINPSASTMASRKTGLYLNFLERILIIS